jgi:chromosome segregation ATPase
MLIYPTQDERTEAAKRGRQAELAALRKLVRELQEKLARHERQIAELEQQLSDKADRAFSF